VKRIGAGGMGSVYRAEEPAMGREVAIKILHPNLKGRSDLVSRFRREARAMSQLKHPHTVRVFSYGELEDGSLFIVMEMLEGKNLNQTVRKGGPLPPSRAIPIVSAACRALHEAHEMGIVHRDLKPENIFVCEEPEKDYAKVLDFGLAKVTEAQMQPGSMILTQEGMVFGTPEFMSPEQARGSALDARSDIYSLACILYEALTGKLPFIAKTPMEYVGKHVTAAPIPLEERVEGMTFPPGLGKVIEKALSKNPAHRYQTALELADALEPFMRTGSQPDGSQTSSPAHVQLGSGPQGKTPHAGASSGALILVAVACMVLGGLGAVILMNVLGK
jgi:eukaryotic-like serine/threonine-protein kinase